jgi:hypothetical protein
LAAPRPDRPEISTVAGVLDRKLVTLEKPDVSGKGSQVVLHDLSSGADRVLASDAIAEPAVGDGVMVWPTDSGELMSMSYRADRDEVTRVDQFGTGVVQDVALSGTRVASLVITAVGEPKQVRLEDVSGDHKTSLTVDVTAGGLELAGDGRYLVWQQAGASPGFHVRDLDSGKEVVFLPGAPSTLGFSVSRQFLSWQPLPHQGQLTPSLYDLSSNDLRLTEDTGASARFAAVLGDWFVWQESGAYYFYRLPR